MSTNKSFSTETSKRYSRALYEVSKDSGDLEKIEVDVKNFQSLFDSSSEVKNFMQNPTHSIETQNKVIDLLSDEFGFTKNLKNFLLLLIEKRRIFFVIKILKTFLKLCSKNRGEVEASLISSKELSSVELENISTEMSSSMGSKIKFDYKVDKDLIGGFKLQLGSFMIDSSIKNKLKKYEQKMLEN
jgi:F-type H+-transporting ATPase subunit delta